MDSVSSVQWVSLRKGRYSIPSLLEHISGADHILVEAMKGKLHLSTRELGPSLNDPFVPQLAAVLKTATPYPAFHFTGFHPDFARLEGTGCSRIVVAAHAMGLSEAEAAELFNSYIYSVLGYFDEYGKAERYALQVGQACSMDLSRVLKPIDGKAFMHIPCQPTIGFWMRFAGMLCEHVGVEHDPDAIAPIDTAADELIWPVYPELADRWGVAGSLEFKAQKNHDPISFDEMVAKCYTLLDNSDAAKVCGREATQASIAKLREELAA